MATKPYLQRVKQDYKVNRTPPSGKDPFALFKRWLAQAKDNPEPNAMCLGTTTEGGFPRVRMVLLKYFDEQGFVFFTNYESKKAEELMKNPFASLLFYWGEVERQVRIEGKVKRTSRKENEEYFKLRPRSAQVAAWASPQSSEIPNHKFIAKRAKELERSFTGEVPCPPFWGGFRLEPLSFEFWQGQPSRLHHRLYFEKRGGSWVSKILAP